MASYDFDRFRSLRDSRLPRGGVGLYREAKPATFCESDVYFGDLVGSTQSAEVESIGGESFWDGLNSQTPTVLTFVAL